MSLHWIVGLRVDVPEYFGHGEFKGRIRNNWKQRQVTVRLAKDRCADGWIVDGNFVAPSHDDTQSAAPHGRAEGSLVQQAAVRGTIENNPPGTYATAHTVDCAADPEPVEPDPEAEIDLSKPLTREVLDHLKFFALQKHVFTLTGLRPATKEKAMELLETGNLIAA